MVDVWLLDRSLTKRLRPVRWSSVDFNRLMNDLSQGSCEVPIDYQQSLAGLTAWQHGLGIFIDGTLEWSGPVTGAVRPPGDPTTVKVTARDRCAWMTRRFVANDIVGTADLGYFFDQLVLEGTRRDNRFGLFSSTPPTGVSAERSYTANSGASVFSGMQDLARSGMDWTAFREQVISGPAGRLFTDRLVVGEEAFLGQIGAEIDGLSQGNSQATAGAATGGSDGFSVFGKYEAWDRTIGLLEQFETEENVRDNAHAEEVSRKRWSQFATAPLVVSFPPLSPAFPGTTADLIPGKKLRLQIDDPLFDLARDYSIIEASFSATMDSSGTIASSWTLDMEDL